MDQCQPENSNNDEYTTDNPTNMSCTSCKESENHTVVNKENPSICNYSHTMDQIQNENSTSEECSGNEPSDMSCRSCIESDSINNTELNREKDAVYPLEDAAGRGEDSTTEINKSECDTTNRDISEPINTNNPSDTSISNHESEVLKMTSDTIDSTMNQLDMEKQAETVATINIGSSLHRILQYNSDESEDEDIESSSKSSEESSSSSSDSESDVQLVDNGEEDEDADQFILPNGKSKPQTKSNTDCDLLDPSLLVNLSNLKIDYEKEEFTYIGNIANFIDTTVTVEALEKTESYDMDTVLFIEDGNSKKPFGGVTDVIGPVSQPVYCVQLPSSEDIENLGLKEGMKVYSAPKSEYAKYVFVKDLLKMKGTDASWIGDEEQPTDEEDNSEEEDERPTLKKRPHDREQNQRPFNNRNRFRGNRNNVMNMSNRPTAAPNAHMLPHGFDPRVPPPFVPNTGFGFQNHSSTIPTWPYQQRGFHTYFQSPRRFQRIRGNNRNYNRNLPPNS